MYLDPTSAMPNHKMKIMNFDSSVKSQLNLILNLKQSVIEVIYVSFWWCLIRERINELKNSPALLLEA